MNISVPNTSDSKHSVFDEAPGSMTRYTIQLAY